MHRSSYRIVRKFIRDYVHNTKLEVADLGSQVMPGQAYSYRELFTNPDWHYTGMDISAGNNVDVVLENGYKFPFEDNHFDIIISGQAIEHIEFPWVWFVEMARILKHSGVCCVVAPATAHEHRYPIDTYRYYPDGMKALAKWSGLKVIKAERLEYTNDPRKKYKTIQDTYLIAKKP